MIFYFYVTVNINIISVYIKNSSERNKFSYISLFHLSILSENTGIQEKGLTFLIEFILC